MTRHHRGSWTAALGAGFGLIIAMTACSTDEPGPSAAARGGDTTPTAPPRDPTGGGIDPTTGGPTRDDPPRDPSGGGGTTGSDPGSLPGTLPGSLQVSATGAATYAIPLTFAPGVNGLVPSLGLDYSSENGNGLLGMGWDLSGLSTIHRCSSNLRHEGFEQAVDFTVADRLCLDGQRLIPVIPATYGKPGAEYRTEAAANLRIVGNGSMQDDGTSFTVYYPNGRIGSFGVTSDAIVKVYEPAAADGSQRATPFAWSIRRLEDRYRNRIDFAYVANKRPGRATPLMFDTDHRIHTITYAGNRMIEFRYARRQDVIAGYFSGVYNVVSQRLSRVVGWVDGAPYRTYALDYAVNPPWPAPVEWADLDGTPAGSWYGWFYGFQDAIPNHDTGRSRIAALRECNGDETICKPATQLTWHTGVTGAGALEVDDEHPLAGVEFPTPASVGGDEPEIFRQLTGDFDHDGTSDLMVAQDYDLDENQGTWKLWSTGFTGLGFERIDTGVKVRYRPQFETRPGDFAHRYFVDLGVPLAQVVNYDGREGADVAAVLPARRLGDLLDEHEDPAFDGNAIAHPGYIGEGVQIIRKKYDGTWEELLLAEPSGHHMLYSYWLNLNGDGLSDLLYCRGVVDVAKAYADAVDGHFPNLAYHWTEGRLYSVLNQPGIGIDFATARDTNKGCSTKDMVQIFDVDGDGDDEFLRILFAGHGTTPDQRVEPEDWDPNYTVNTYDPVDGGLRNLPLRYSIPTDYLQRVRSGYSLPRGMGSDLKGDFNGDGLVDLIRFQLAEGDLAANLPALTAITKFSDAFVWPANQFDNPIGSKSELAGPHLYVNTGRGLLDTRGTALTNTYEAAAYWRHFLSAFPMDYNGDGITDLMMRDPSKELWDGTGEDPETPEPSGAARLYVFFGDPAIIEPTTKVRMAETPILHQHDKWIHRSGNSCEEDGEGDGNGDPGDGDWDAFPYQEAGEVYDEDGADPDDEDDDEGEETCGPWESYRVFVPRRHYIAMDANGDGLTDVVTFDPNDWLPGSGGETHLQVWAHAGAHRFDLVTSVQNGLAAIDRVEYKPMGDPWGIYVHQEWQAPADRPAPPSTTVVGSRPLVYRLFRDTSFLLGVERRWEYTYRNARADLTDASFLGFDFVTATESRSGAPDDGNHPDYDHWKTAEHTWYDTSTYDAQTKRFPFAGRIRSRLLLTDAKGYHHADEPQSVYHVIKQRLSYVQGATDLTGTYRANLTSKTVEEYQGAFYEDDPNDVFCLLVAPASCADAPGFNGGWLDHDPTSTIVDTYSNHDAYGHAWRIVTALADGSTQVAERTFQNDAQAWLIGLPTSAQTTSQTALGSETRHQTTTYNPQGSVHYTVAEPDDPTYQLGALYTYDTLGNQASETLDTATDSGTRHSETYWMPDGVFPFLKVNALGHETRLTFDDRFGQLTKLVEPSGNQTSYVYNDLGYLIWNRSLGADGAALDVPTTTSYWAVEPEPGFRQTKIRSEAAGYGATETIFDRLGRPTRHMTTGAQSNPIYQDTRYDLMGRVAQISIPTFVEHPIVGDPSQTFATAQYDFLDRPRKAIAADLTETHYEYSLEYQPAFSLPTTTKIDPQGRQSWKTYDLLGQPIAWQDGVEASTPSAQMCAAYGPFGTMEVLKPCTPTPGKWPVTMDYDRYGRRTRLQDVQLGESTNAYNGFGELASTVDAKAQQVVYRYDALGRIVERWDHGAPEDGMARWVYDTEVPGFLDEMESPDGNLVGYAYDVGHSNRVVGIDVYADGDDAYQVRYDYDPDHDRATVIHYPGAVDQEPFAVRQVYDDAGHLAQVVSDNDHTVYWTRNQTNAFEQINSERFGNGVTTTHDFAPLTGQLQAIRSTHDGDAFQELGYEWFPDRALKRRTDAGPHLLLHQTETFAYDGLDRVLSATKTNGVESDTQEFAYDGFGNLQSRTGLASYTYVGERLVGVSGSAYQALYTYDANGNRIQQVKGGGVTAYTYSPLNKITRLVHAGPDGTGDLRFTYDAEHNLVRQFDVIAGTSTTFIGDLFERRSTPTGIEDVFSVSAASGVVAQVTRSYQHPSDDSFVATTRYLHRDHLGSLDVVTDEDGAVIERLDYDAFGERRHPIWFDDGQDPLAAAQVRVGFTGHDTSLESLGLINMKGRLYDPSHGRFLQPDPFVQAPFFNQSPNRYSYVFNNPLSLVDPSGYNAEGGDGEDFIGQGKLEDDGTMTLESLDGGAMFSSNICVGCETVATDWDTGMAQDYGDQFEFGEDQSFEHDVDVAEEAGGDSVKGSVHDAASTAGKVLKVAFVGWTYQFVTTGALPKAFANVNTTRLGVGAVLGWTAYLTNDQPTATQTAGVASGTVSLATNVITRVATRNTPKVFGATALNRVPATTGFWPKLAGSSRLLGRFAGAVGLLLLAHDAYTVLPELDEVGREQLENTRDAWLEGGGPQAPQEWEAAFRGNWGP